jgi:hypothetical protein
VILARFIGYFISKNYSIESRIGGSIVRRRNYVILVGFIIVTTLTCAIGALILIWGNISVWIVQLIIGFALDILPLEIISYILFVISDR